MKRFDVRAKHIFLFCGVAMLVTACGGGGGSSSSVTTPPPAPVSYIGTTGVFVAAANPSNEWSAVSVTDIAGKRQYLRGTVDLMTGQDVGQSAGVEIYKSSDGHVYAIDMIAVGAPTP